ncbi:unnamed protein product [Ectocarpus sp. 12 AP-2014]
MDGGGRSGRCGLASGRTDGSDTTTLVIGQLCRSESFAGIAELAAVCVLCGY